MDNAIYNISVNKFIDLNDFFDTGNFWSFTNQRHEIEWSTQCISHAKALESMLNSMPHIVESYRIGNLQAALKQYGSFNLHWENLVAGASPPAGFQEMLKLFRARYTVGELARDQVQVKLSEAKVFAEMAMAKVTTDPCQELPSWDDISSLHFEICQLMVWVEQKDPMETTLALLMHVFRIGYAAVDGGLRQIATAQTSTEAAGIIVTANQSFPVLLDALDGVLKYNINEVPDFSMSPQLTSLATELKQLLERAKEHLTD